MIALLEAKAAGLWSCMHSPGSLPRGVVVYSIDGALFFGAAEKLEQTLAHIQRPATTLILRMSQLPFVDATGISAIEEIITDFLKHGATVILSEVRPNVLQKLERAGVIRQLGSGNTTATLALAIERVKAIEAVKETWIRIGKSCKSHGPLSNLVNKLLVLGRPHQQPQHDV
jgi:MFS superfamily sulfate permease-like transporter